MHTKSREVHCFPVHFPAGVMFSGFFRRILHGTRDLGFHVLQAVQQQRIEGPAHPGTDHLHHFAVGTGVAVHRAGSPAARTRPPGPSTCARWGSAPLQAVRIAAAVVPLMVPAADVVRRAGKGVVPAFGLFFQHLCSQQGVALQGYGARPRSVGLPCAASPRRFSILPMSCRAAAVGNGAAHLPV